MGNDLPDYQTEVYEAAVEATSFRSGLDADKPASPAAGDIWLARDTYYLYVCNTAGSWEKVAKLYLLLTDAATLYLALAGGTMTGDIAMGGKSLLNIFMLTSMTNNSFLFRSKRTDNPLAFEIQTPGVTPGFADTTRLEISGALATAVARWSAITHIGMKLGGALDVNSQALNNVLISQTQPVGQALDTIYQNTSGKIRVISVSVYCGVLKSATSVTGNSLVFAYCENANPPTIQVGKVGVYITFDGLATIGQTYTYDSITFIVPPNYYYKLTTSKANDGITPVLTSWTEWDLL